jgi:hypothetical protein
MEHVLMIDLWTYSEILIKSKKIFNLKKRVKFSLILLMASLQKFYSRVSKSQDVAASSTSEQQKIPVVDITKAAPVLGGFAVDKTNKLLYYGNGTIWVQLAVAP